MLVASVHTRTRRGFLCLLLLALPFVASTGAPAQAKREKNAKPQPEADKDPAKKEPPKESPRLQKLKHLTFDRRPSAILRAWAPQPPVVKSDATKDKKDDPLATELSAFQRNVTLGNWTAVKAYLGKLPTDEAKAGYQQLLRMPRRRFIFRHDSILLRKDAEGQFARHSQRCPKTPQQHRLVQEPRKGMSLAVPDRQSIRASLVLFLATASLSGTTRCRQGQMPAHLPANPTCDCDRLRRGQPFADHEDTWVRAGHTAPCLPATPGIRLCRPRFSASRSPRGW